MSAHVQFSPSCVNFLFQTCICFFYNAFFLFHAKCAAEAVGITAPVSGWGSQMETAARAPTFIPRAFSSLEMETYPSAAGKHMWYSAISSLWCVYIYTPMWSSHTGLSYNMRLTDGNRWFKWVVKCRRQKAQHSVYRPFSPNKSNQRNIRLADPNLGSGEPSTKFVVL